MPRVRAVVLLCLLVTLAVVSAEEAKSSKFTATGSTGVAKTTALPELNAGFLQATTQSFAMIIVSELGDKTFFIAAIMAMQYPRFTIFLAAIGALALMTVLSVAMGYVVLVLLPPLYTHYIAVGLFAVFGVRLLYDAYHMDANEPNDELEEVQTELRERHLVDESSEGEDAETGLSVEEKKQRRARKAAAAKPWYSEIMTPVFAQCFMMTLTAEWGDRSQITTSVSASSMDGMGVVVGGIAGHAVCTGLAVLGGKYLAVHISVRTVSFVGGALFLVFAITELMMNPHTQ
eukprot:Amastigsp_a678886_127.p1 type:complete len:289 gc:universal Amastigsp_a678886_127:893-27(-)